MDISWKSIVARDIIEISVPIHEYHAQEGKLQPFFKSKIREIQGYLNVIKILKKSLDARKADIKYNLRLELF